MEVTSLNDVEEGGAATLAQQPVQLECQNVSVDVKTKGGPEPTKRILDDISGIFGPRELVAIMGPSGSGKTTMLNALTGVTRPSSGSVLVNGKPINQRVMKKITSLVPQDDLLTAVLTPAEALIEAGYLKTKMSKAEILRRAEELLATFALVECRDVSIGHPEGVKGLSGGQRKRLSVALELVSGPSLLFLDEPTSGLDAVSALSLVRLLSSLSKAGATVITTIHQPSSTIFFTFDRLVVLARGKLCYLGPLSPTQPLQFFKGAGFVCPEYHNPADFTMEILSESADAQARLHKRLKDEPVDSRQRDASMPELLSTGHEHESSLGRQLQTLLVRNARMLRREPALARARIGSSALIGSLMGVLYWQMGKAPSNIPERIALLLFSMIFMALSAVLPTILTVLPEIAVMRKEHRNNWYSLKAFYVAKIISDMPLIVLPPLLYALTMGTMSNLTNGEPWRFGLLYLSLLFMSVAAHSWAMVISCKAPSLPVAIFCVPISVLPMVLFAGFFKNVESITWAFRWISYVDVLRYGWDAMTIAAFYDLELEGGISANQFVLKDRLNMPDASLAVYWSRIGIMAAFMVLFRVLAYMALKTRV